MWRFGHVLCSDFDFSHIDTSRNLRDYAANKDGGKKLSAILYSLSKKYPKALGEFETDPLVLRHDERWGLNPDSWHFNRKALKSSAQIAIQDEIKGDKAAWVKTWSAVPGKEFTEHKLGEQLKQSRTFEKSHFIGALEVIRLYRPEGWYEAVKDCINDLVLRKWRECYCFVYIGQTCIPSFITFLIYGIMWQHRKLAVLENKGLPGWTATPLPANDFEAQCGWASIQNSVSGRLQAVLVLYGVLALLGVAVGQQRIGTYELDPKGQSKIKATNLADFFFLNLNSILCAVVSAMFIAIGTARVMAGSECETFYLQAEKNATAIAGLFLAVNLLNTLRPVRAFGAFFTTIFHMIVTDMFKFSVVYLAFFLSFLLAIQSVYAANNHLLDGIAQSSLINISEFHTRRKAVASQLGGGPPVDPESCSAKIMSMSDTAFKLLTMSLGDGFGDVLQDSRSVPNPACGGFKADFILIVLFFAWIVLTNILAMNLFIAMISQTFEKKFEHSNESWTLDIVARVMSYERGFPDLMNKAHSPSRSSLGVWSVLEDVGLTLMCVPEVYWLVWLWSKISKVWRLCCGRKQESITVRCPTDCFLWVRTACGLLIFLLFFRFLADLLICMMSGRARSSVVSCVEAKERMWAARGCLHCSIGYSARTSLTPISRNWKACRSTRPSS